MGDFRIEINAVGGHGCQREVGDGETVEASCGRENCPDCMAREFVKKLGDTGNLGHNPSATLTHWPAGAGSPVDNLITLERTGSF